MEQVISSLKFSLLEKEQFNQYYELLVEENKKYNLTNITEINEVYIKHFYDSLMMGKFVDLTNDVSLCDIGSGAGFPSIPLKIKYPNLKVTIIEPTQKRINFLKLVCEKLNLKDVTLICDRAETAIINYREKFDIVTARAVSNLSMLLELTIPFVKVNGIMVAYKGQAYNEEIENAKLAFEKLNSKVIYIHKYELINELGSRYLIEIKKNEKTNIKYPRRFAEIKKKPL